MFNTPETNFISSLRKNFINFVNDLSKLKFDYTAICRNIATADRTHSRINPLAKHLSARL
nr:hypothetical protein [uncultured Campylobacter sp.]